MNNISDKRRRGQEEPQTGGTLQRSFCFFETLENFAKSSTDFGSRGSVGISPLLATVLLLMISVAIAGVIMNWSSALTKEQTRSISNKTGTAVKCGDIYIEDVYLDFTDNVSRVIVRSVETSTQILSAEFLTARGISLKNLTQLPVNISKGEVKTVSFDIRGNITSCGEFGEAIIVASCASDKYSQTPRNC